MAKCQRCNSEFQITEEHRNYVARFDMPEPTKCPDCRLQQRLTFRNERTLYKRECSKTNQGIISIYHPNSPYVVYKPEEWWSDRWDGLNYGRDFDFSRPFFEQLHELALEVPRIALFNVNPFNSDYCQQAYNNKNSYLCVVVKDCEDCMYLSHSNNMIDCYDCSHMQHCELSYSCLDSERLYASVACQSCQNSNDCYFCYDCIGCNNCLFCTGLRNKKYYIFNEAYSKEDYERRLKELNLGSRASYTKAAEEFRSFLEKQVHRETQNLNIDNCTGNYLINAKNSVECFDAFEIEDCAYCTWIFESKDCRDVYGMGTSEVVYQCLGVENLQFGAVNTFVSDSSEAFYSDLCFYCMHLFGCVGLRNKKYCILNKQYSPDNYEKLKKEIITHMKSTGEWGEFFPTALSPYCYNETAAQEYFPLSEEEANKTGFNWRGADKKEYQPQNYQVADSISDVTDEITDALLACRSCKKNYKIVPAELRYYRKMNLPIPSDCTDCRYMKRAWSRNPRKLWQRSCDKCNKEMLSPYAKLRPETVYCESCYREEVD